jgi:MFS family permease
VDGHDLYRFAISRAIIMPIAGTLSDRVGRKIFIVLGLVSLTATSLLYLAANTVYSLTAVR